jgi:dienelactone hydrolase
MKACRLLARVFFVVALSVPCLAQPAPAPRDVTLTASDGTVLKGTYFAASKPGPGVMLLHQCNQQRKSWDGLAQRLTARGMNVLTLDYRGFGESGGARFATLNAEENRKAGQAWRADFDMAFQYLVSQAGVSRDVIGAGGASCGVNNSVQLARRHREVKALMLLSGGTDRDGRFFLQSSKIPVFTAAADDDGNVSDIMQWLFSLSANSDNRFQRYATGGHGAQMFAPHPELLDFIADWFAATLMNQATKLPEGNGARFDPKVTFTLTDIDRGGASDIEKRLGEARARDPKARLFPEGIVNLIGYEHLQAGDTKGAIEILKLNAAAYPNSPNVYDSLADAYVAEGNKDLAAQNAKKCLELLASDTTDTEDRRKAIRGSAEQKLKELESAR